MDHDAFNVRMGRYLREQREGVGLSSAEVAGGLGLQESEISRIEAGRRPIGFTEFLDWVELLGVDVRDAVREVLKGSE